MASVPSQYDRVVIGAGIFGLYAALRFTREKHRTLIIEKEKEAFLHASRVNQARIHNGYHYPRSLSTALGTAQYVKRFVTDFDFAINKSFKKIYAIAKRFSYTDAGEYESFCSRAGIPCERINSKEYFNPSVIEAAYLTEEYGYDADAMRDYLLHELTESGYADFAFQSEVISTERDGSEFLLTVQRGKEERVMIRTPYVVNATYAGVNDVIGVFGADPIGIKHERAELVLCTVSPKLRDVGLTVMDGPFFSLMPFGFSGLHSLSAVSYTPLSADAGTDSAAPKTRFDEMRQLARKFLAPDLDCFYRESIFATKAILTKAEVDDARPTLIAVHSEEPRLVTILSGKLNTIFDLDDTL